MHCLGLNESSSSAVVSRTTGGIAVERFHSGSLSERRRRVGVSSSGSRACCLLLFAILPVQTYGADGAPTRSDRPPTTDVERAAVACIGGHVDDRIDQCLIAARAGDDNAPGELARAYRFGWYGAPKDAAEAVRWEKVSSERGSGVARSVLGLSYLCGFGVQRDTVEARRWFKRATEGGRQSGISPLGYMYEAGIGGRTDYKAAVKWYELVACTN